MKLTFKEETHEYFFEGILKPSVTQIIREYFDIVINGEKYYVNRFTGDVIPAWIFEKAGDFGSAVHKAVRYLLGKEGLDYEELPPDLRLVITQFDLWREKYNPEIILCEQPMYSHQFSFCGTPDILCIIKKLGKVLLDIKTGLYSMVGVQLSAYEKLYRENYKDRRSIIKPYVLHLPKDGSDFNFKPVPVRQAWQEFQSLHFDYNYQRKAA